MGFSMSACSAAVCVEDSEDGAIAKFTTALQGSSRLLGKSQPHEIIAGAVACTHTNQFLLAAQQSVPTTEEDLRNSQGNIDYGAMIANDDVFKDASQNGIKWLLIKRAATQQFPTLPSGGRSGSKSGDANGIADVYRRNRGTDSRANRLETSC